MINIKKILIDTRGRVLEFKQKLCLDTFHQISVNNVFVRFMNKTVHICKQGFIIKFVCIRRFKTMLFSFLYLKIQKNIKSFQICITLNAWTNLNLKSARKKNWMHSTENTANYNVQQNYLIGLKEKKNVVQLYSNITLSNSLLKSQVRNFNILY